MKNIKLLIVIGLVFINVVASAQNRPTLDSAYLVKEYEAFKNSLSSPKEELLSIYVSSGANFTKVNPTEGFSVANSFSDEEKKYQSEIGYQYEVGVLIPFKKLDIGIGVNYAQQVFSIESNLTDGFNNNLDEKSNFISIPLTLKYYFLESRLRPYAMIGIKFTRLLESELSGHRNGGQPTIFKENILPMRNSFLFFTSVGVGAQYVIRKGSFFIEAIYFKGSSNMSVASKRYNNPNLFLNGGYVSDDFKINRIAINFGYAFSIFKK